MAYSTITDLELAKPTNLLVELTDDEGLSTDPEDMTQSQSDNGEILGRLNRAIADADGEIDSYIRGRYAVPLDDVPARIRRISVILTMYNLYDRRSHNFEMPESIMTGKKMVRKDLELINKGKIDLGIDPAPSPSAKALADTDGPDRYFTNTTLEQF